MIEPVKVSAPIGDAERHLEQRRLGDRPRSADAEGLRRVERGGGYEHRR